LILSLKAFSQQEDSLVNSASNVLEDYVENQELESFDYNTIFENLEAFRSHPININTASREDLRQLIFLTEQQIDQIVEHRNRYGKFLLPEELQVVPSLDIESIRLMSPFITLGAGANLKKFVLSDQFKGAKQNVFLKWERTLEKKDGYVPRDDRLTPYVGSPNYLYLRYRFNNSNRMMMGFTAEKDAGEAFFKSPNQKGFDFYSGFIFIKDLNSTINYLAIGDYSVSFGQGLILHNDFGAGKSSFVMGIKKGGRPIRPYSSVNEVNYFRGAAVNIDVTENSTFTIFGSRNDLAGSIQIDTLENDGFEFFGSIRQDGLHRTESEILTKNTIQQHNAGASYKMNLGNLGLGLNGLYTSLSKPLLPSDELYKKYYFSGDKLLNGSVDFSYSKYSYNLFGEFAYSDNGGKAWLVGLLTSISPKVDVSLLFRDYDKDYQVLNANAFADGSQPINERGLYGGILINPNKHFRISSYFDFWKHPWLRFRKDAPSTGKEFFVKLEYIKKRKYNLYLQYRVEQKQENYEQEGKKIDGLTDLWLHRLRLHFSHKYNKSLEFRNRIEFSYYRKGELNSKGYIVYQDIIYKPIANPFSMTTRFALFDTDDFNSRIYTYENDILYEYGIPFFQNKGSRFYVNFRYNLTRWLTAEFRYSRTHYTNVDHISSGYEEILGNNKTDLKAQLKFSF